MRTVKSVLWSIWIDLRTGVQTLTARQDFRMNPWERTRLRHSPRLWHTYSQLCGRRIEITDPCGYLLCYREIFLEQTYRFVANRPDPLIVDCGANIGMSAIYFKYLYPQARIIAFEPDPEIMRVLERNVNTFQLENIELYERAVWDSETELLFQRDGSIAGRLVDEGAAGSVIPVRTVRLRDFLDQDVDLLKIDIEGAEYQVLQDCQDHLSRVAHVFVEYHGKPRESPNLHEVLRMLQRAGFRYHVKDAHPIAHPFIHEERNPMYDLQLNVFAFRDTASLGAIGAKNAD